LVNIVFNTIAISRVDRYGLFRCAGQSFGLSLPRWPIGDTGQGVPTIQVLDGERDDSSGALLDDRPVVDVHYTAAVAEDAMFARLGTAEAERTSPWLRPRVATAGHGSRLLKASQPPESPVTLHSESDSSVAAPAERPHRWSEDWEPLEDLLLLLADEPHDRLLDPHDALFAQVGR
jgi:hypothetical protein